MNHFFRQTVRGEAAEQERIYNQVHRKLYFTSLRILGNQFDAEEVMHDTLLKYFSSQNKFGNIKEMDAWMTRVCINLSIDRLRVRKPQDLNHLYKELSCEPDEPEETQSYSFKGVTAEMVKVAMEKVATGYRVILSLLLFEGYDYQEISQILNLKEVTVRSQFIRGKARLIEELESMKAKCK